MKDTYRVCVLGCGPRGEEHLHGFAMSRDRFEVVALCDLDEEKLTATAAKFEIAKTYADAEAMLAAEKPDVFSFTTPPRLRLPLVELGVKHGVAAIAFEKPLALSLAEARRIRDICDEANVKWLVSHQQKYGNHYRRVKEMVDAGRIGELHTIHVTAQAWLMQLGTHMIDYALWLNGGVAGEWAIGQAQGTEKLSDSHPSPDYVFGQIAFANGVRCIAEFGPLAPSFLEDPGQFWLDDTLTAYGSHGYARVIVGKGWEALTKDSGGELLSGPGCFNPTEEQPRYLKDLADWLDDDAKEHPCSGRLSYRGFEMAMALCLSCTRRGHVCLPIENLPEIPLFETLAHVLPDP